MQETRTFFSQSLIKMKSSLKIAFWAVKKYKLNINFVTPSFDI